MEELTIEEKASRYDEVLKVLHKYDGANIMFTQDLKEEMFPELKETWNEKVRKWIIEMVEEVRKANPTNAEHNGMCSEAIAWLEKQGEKKPTKNIVETWKDMRLEVYQQASGNRHEPNYSDDTTKIFSLNDIDEIIEKMSEQNPAGKAEPMFNLGTKFKVGDWAVSKLDGKVRQILGVHHDRYNNYYVIEDNEYDIKEYDRLHHHWTIQDAKAGDILADDCGIYIFDEFDKDDERCFLCIGAYQYSQKVYEYERMLCSIDVRPATKEQRDLLFQKMHEAGYEWDDGKKELKKIERKPVNTFEPRFKINDKVIHKETGKIWTIHWYLADTNSYYVIDDEKLIHHYTEDVLESAEQNPAWSEEDETNASYICAALDCYHRLREERSNTNGQEDLDKARNWLYNKLKSLRPQSQWKPSDEQMEALNIAMQGVNDPLFLLYQDLKKLK